VSLVAINDRPAVILAGFDVIYFVLSGAANAAAGAMLGGIKAAGAGLLG
jgi:hypothetical protein